MSVPSTHAPTSNPDGNRFAVALAQVQPIIDSPDGVDAATLAGALNLAAVCALGLGRPDDAEASWRRCIEVKPDFSDAWSSLGKLLVARERLTEAETLYRGLLAIDAHHAEAHHQLGAVLQKLGRHAEAVRAYREALAILPDHAETHHNLGFALHALGHLDEAEAAYLRARTIRADYPETHFNLGNVLRDLGRPDEAEAAYRKALALRPQYAEALNNLGNVLGARGRAADAEAAYREALAIRPHYPEALNNFGGLLKTLGRLPEAEFACRLALSIRADYAEAHSALGSILIDQKRLPEAEAAYRAALAARPDYAEAQYNLGVVLHLLKRLPEAAAAYRQTLRMRPDSFEAHHNLGGVLRALNRRPEAAASFRRALEIRPDFAETHANLGGVLKELDMLPEAVAAYRRALEISPDYQEARFSLGVLLLTIGRLEEGWPLYEVRYELKRFINHATRRLLGCPQWQGESLAGKTLLVWQEDGLGDMVQFGRYLPLLKARGATHIAVACLPVLRRLFGALEGVDAVLDHETARVKSAGYDCWTSFMSAPWHERTTEATIPAPLHILPDPSLVEAWRTRLDALPPGPRIGLVWKGNAKHSNDANRSLPSLAWLAPLWSVPGVQFVSLQKGQGEDEAASPPAGQPLLHLGSDLTDFADTAAIVAQLDLVICVDTSTAHLAGSLGTPCWVLLPAHDLDWRWMRDREDSPWYPGTMRLFRQPRHHDWSTTVERVRDACMAMFAANGDGQ